MFRVTLFVLCAIATTSCKLITVDTNQDGLYQALLHRVEKLETIILSHPKEMEDLRRELYTEMDDMRHTHAEEIVHLNKTFVSEMEKQQLKNNKFVSALKNQFDKDVRTAKLECHEKKEIVLNNGDRRHLHVTKPLMKSDGIPTQKTVKGEFMQQREKDTTDFTAQGVSKIDLNHQAPRVRRQHEQKVIAFFATLSSNVAHLGTGQDIAFDYVITNIGNAYDRHHGLFRAPVSGVYAFSTTVLIAGTDTAHFGFVLNSTRLTIMYLNGPEKSGDSSSNSIIVHLNQGDEISIQHYDSDKTIYGNNHSMMSGFLLAQDDGEPSIVG